MIRAITDLPTIVQGALGSALFWVVLTLITVSVPSVRRMANKVSRSFALETKVRKYIYSKYTSQDGLAYYPKGYFFAFSKVLINILYGMLFVCIALLFGSTSTVVYPIALVGAMYYFLRALPWLIEKTSFTTPLEQWSFIAHLENELFGEVSEDTKQWLVKFKDESK